MLVLPRMVPIGWFLRYVLLGIAMGLIVSCSISDEQRLISKFQSSMEKEQYDTAASLCYKAKVLMIYNTPEVVFTCAPQVTVVNSFSNPPKQETYWPCAISASTAKNIGHFKKRGINLYGKPIIISDYAKEAPDDCYACAFDNYTIVGFTKMGGPLQICFIHFKS